METGTSKPKLVTILLIVALTASSLIMIKSASAQSIPKPSVPQFSIQVVDRSYDIPPTTYTDPYNGQQVTNPGGRVEDLRIEGEIRNQHFTPYMIPDPNLTSSSTPALNIDFYYDIRFKGHFGDDWRSLIVGEYPLNYLKQKYNQDYTNFTADSDNAIVFRDGDQIDFQVRAVIGYRAMVFATPMPYRVLNGEFSDWSQTLTITFLRDTTNSSTHASNIDNSAYPTLATPQASPTATISPTPTVPEFPAPAIIPLLFVTIAFTIVVKKKFTLKGAIKHEQN